MSEKISKAIVGEQEFGLEHNPILQEVLPIITELFPCSIKKYYDHFLIYLDQVGIVKLIFLDEEEAFSMGVGDGKAHAITSTPGMDIANSLEIIKYYTTGDIKLTIFLRYDTDTITNTLITLVHELIHIYHFYLYKKLDLLTDNEYNFELVAEYLTFKMLQKYNPHLQLRETYHYAFNRAQKQKRLFPDNQVYWYLSTRSYVKLKKYYFIPKMFVEDCKKLDSIEKVLKVDFSFAPFDLALMVTLVSMVEVLT
jgi:hypothetical protein